MALAAQLAAWAQAQGAGCSVLAEPSAVLLSLGGARVTLRVAALDEDAAQVTLCSDEVALRLSVTLSETTPFVYAIDDALAPLAEAANEALERGCADRSPLGAALSALAAAATRAPSLVAALRSAADEDDEGDAQDEGDGDSDSDSAGCWTDGWYNGGEGSATFSGAHLRALQASFLFTHAAQAAAACAATPPLSGAALPHLRCQPYPEACAVQAWLETLELPTPGLALALGLHPASPLRLTIAYTQHGALACTSAASVFDGAEFSWLQPDAPNKPPAAHEGVVVPRFGLDVFLPGLTKELTAKWRQEAEAGPAKRTRRPESQGSVGHAADANANAFTWLLQHAWDALANAAANCAVCRAPLPAPGARLSPCSRDVCTFNMEEMGGCPMLPLLRESGGASAALHCALAHAAACSYNDSTRDTFEPFPSFLLEKSQRRQRAGFFDAHATGATASVDLAQLAQNKKLGRAAIVGVLCSLPPLAELAALPDETALRRRLLKHDWHSDSALALTSTVSKDDLKAAAAMWPDDDVPDLAWRVLQFVLSTPRVQLQLLAGADKLAGLPEEAVQLAIVGNSDAREQTFQARKAAAGGSFFAFHGSNTGNWYSIVRNGLRSLSQTAMMANGAAFGAGVYLAANLSMSMAYCGRGQEGVVMSAWQRAAADFEAAFVEMDVARHTPVLLALCEVTNAGPSSHTGGRVGAGMYVVGTDAVALRYLLLLPQGAKAAEAASLLWGASPVHEHIAALRSAALEAAEVERAQLREPRRLTLHSEAAQAGADAAMERLDSVIAAQTTTASASATGALAMVKEYRKLYQVAPGLGLAVSFVAEDDVFKWRVLMHGWAAVAPELHEDLAAFATATGLPPAIELEFAFSPEHFPFAAPFVRVVRPILAFRTGHVTIGGSICMELLTAKGWSCAVSLESVMVTIRADMVEGGARLDRARFSATSCYSEATAREAFKRVAMQHGWET